jgi:branched-subunit amino acid ABC-type transport system permease component
VIEPLLSAPPINQLLATGGVLFFLQSFATVAFGIDFRNIGIRCRCWRSARCISATPACSPSSPPRSAWASSMSS